ncbi:MAG: SDR family NAD(P)-dependent oxidoreductase [Candidatus Kapaibacterium sp.]
MIALITGAGRGIGRAIAIALAAKGIHTILVARSENQITGVANEIAAAGGKATPLVCDITDSQSIINMHDETSKIGKISILVNNAGIAPSAKIEDTVDEVWQKAMATNASGPFYLIRTYLPDMKSLGEGHIINIASTAALDGFSYTAAYTASKHAMMGLSRAIAKELSRSKIKVSTICPGFVRTNILEISIANIMTKTGKERGEAEHQLGAMNKSGAIIEPEEVAKAVIAELEMPLDPKGREIIL